MTGQVYVPARVAGGRFPTIKSSVGTCFVIWYTIRDLGADFELTTHSACGCRVLREQGTLDAAMRQMAYAPVTCLRCVTHMCLFSESYGSPPAIKVSG